MPRQIMIKKIYTLILTRLIPTKIYLKYAFKRKTNRQLNLDKPKSLNEKIQWLKLNDRKEIYTTYADKYRVRGYIETALGKEYLVPLFDVFHSTNDISLDNVPADTAFIIKSNHDSTGGLIYRDHDKFDVKAVKEAFENKFKRNHYHLTKEYQYKNIKKCTLIEKLLLDKDGKIPNDYKFHCFNGKVEFIYLSIDRETANYRKIYDCNFNAIDVSWCPLGDESKFEGPDITAPTNLDEMIHLAEKLSAEFMYVRIDLYNVDGQIYFGEITQHQGGGFEVITPYEYDKKWGELLKLECDEK